MNATERSLLLAFSGAETSLPALDYGIWLAEQIRLPVTLLGIVEKPARRKQVEQLIESRSTQLQNSGIPYQVLLESGRSRDVICRQAVPDRHLAVFGPFGRPRLRRWLRGRSFRRIFQDIHTPVLYVRQAHPRLRKILVCLGGLGHALSAERWSLYLAERMGASVTLLHVVEPISYDYPVAREIQDHWQDILETDTPQGQNLRTALRMAQEIGVTADFKVRHGDIVHEILAETSAQEYDMIVMGSPYSSNNLRHLFMPNVTAEVAEAVDCPILAASFGQEWIFDEP